MNPTATFQGILPEQKFLELESNLSRTGTAEMKGSHIKWPGGALPGNLGHQLAIFLTLHAHTKRGSSGILKSYLNPSVP